MTAADISTGTLEPTLTWARRRWCLVPCDGHPDGRQATLTIVQEGSVRRGRRMPRLDIEHYGLLEDVDPAHPHPGVRIFLLKKDDSAEVYAVACGDGMASCTCDAARARLPVCKHRDSVRAMCEDGVL